MGKILSVLILAVMFLIPISALAQNKVVVVPMGSNRASGTDGQVQYNDIGKNSGAEVYYDKSTGNLGVGTNTPTSSLEVKGEIRSIDDFGDNRLWGQGRKVYMDGSWNTSPSNANIEYAYSQELATWYGAQSACPANTWVCGPDELAIGDTLVAIPVYTGYSCDYTTSPTSVAWVTGRVPGVPQKGAARALAVGYAKDKCDT